MIARATIFWLLLACLACCGSVAAQSKAVAADAEAAEEAYRRGDYARAKELWTALLEQRGADGRLEYDIGNCEYRLEDYARALWRFERAARALGGDERVRFNLSLAERKLGLQSDEATSFFADARAKVRRLDRGDWFTCGLGLEVVGVLLLAFSLRRRAFVLAGVAALLTVLGAASLVRAATLDPDRILGVVVLEEDTPVRGEPREELDSILRLGAGVRAEFVAKSPGWVRLRIRDREGWVQRGSVGLY